MANLFAWFALFYSCKINQQIETPQITTHSIGTIDSRSFLLAAYQNLLNGNFEESFHLFFLASQADPKNQKIISLWIESLCEYPIEKQEEYWTKLKNSLKSDYVFPSCLESKQP